MASFNYEAVDDKGILVSGEFEAERKDAVVEHLARMNLIPVRITEVGKAGGRGSVLSFGLFDHITPLDRIVLVRNLGAAIKAGLSLVEALDILIADTTRRPMKAVLVQAKSNLENGESLSGTFSSMKDDFPPVFTGLIRAGEFSGKLDDSLDELENHLSREYSLVKKVKAALTYPIILVVAATGVVTLLVLFVVPRLAKAFTQSKVKLPFLTRILLVSSTFFSKHIVLIAIAAFVMVVFIMYFRKTKIGKKLILNIAFHIPVLKELVKKVALVRLTRTLGSLLASGVTLVEALKLTAESVSNDFYRDALISSIGDIEGGVSLAESFKKNPELFPKFLTGLMIVGERTGTAENVLRKFADFYDDEVDNTLKNLTSTLEPVLLLGMGLIVGSIALSVLLPIYQLINSFQ